MTEKLLRVEAPHFVAGAIWVRDGAWKCIEAAPILKWMVNESAETVREYLERKGWKHQWL